MLLHSSLLHWRGVLHSICVHGHRLLHHSLLLWHVLMLLWPWLLVQLLHCSLVQCYFLLLQGSLLLAQRSALLLALAKCFKQLTENLWLHWPLLHWLLLLHQRWVWRWPWLWPFHPPGRCGLEVLPRHGCCGNCHCLCVLLRASAQAE